MNKATKITDSIRFNLAYYKALSTHPQTPGISKWMIAIAIAYLLSPIDIIPDFIPILGQPDDLLIVPLLITLALLLIPRSVKIDVKRKIHNESGNSANSN